MHPPGNILLIGITRSENIRRNHIGNGALYSNNAFFLQNTAVENTQIIHESCICKNNI